MMLGAEVVGGSVGVKSAGCSRRPGSELTTEVSGMLSCCLASWSLKCDLYSTETNCANMEKLMWLAYNQQSEHQVF